MSYARFSDGGDVYVYGTGTGERPHKYVCCDCALPTGMHEAESLFFDSADAILGVRA